MKPGFFKQLCEIAGKENVRTDEPMKQHTTFRIGGAADYFVSLAMEADIRPAE